MSTWNYRVILNTLGNFHLYEVYYDDEGNITHWAEDPMSPYGEGFDELYADVQIMFKAFDLPVLHEIENQKLVQYTEATFKELTNPA